MQALATKIYAGDPRRFSRPLATRDGDYIYEGEKGMMESALFTIKDNQIYKGSDKGWMESPLATVKDRKIYKGDKGFLEKPIATIVDDKLFPGKKGDTDHPIATCKPGDVMSLAAAAVMILLPYE
ncbi:MAG: hypothetical protein AAFN10_14575 [Bacteroidota bacterium]